MPMRRLLGMDGFCLPGGGGWDAVVSGAQVGLLSVQLLHVYLAAHAVFMHAHTTVSCSQNLAGEGTTSGRPESRAVGSERRQVQLQSTSIPIALVASILTDSFGAGGQHWRLGRKGLNQHLLQDRCKREPLCRLPRPGAVRIWAQRLRGCSMRAAAGSGESQPRHCTRGSSSADWCLQPCVRAMSAGLKH